MSLTEVTDISGMTATELRAAIVAEVRSWEGTKYVNNCTVKGKGVNCTNLGASTFKMFGLMPLGATVPAMGNDWNYSKDTDPLLFKKFIAPYGVEIPFDDRLPADAITFYFGQLHMESHWALIVDDDCVTHANSHDGKVKRQRLRRIKSICSVYRHRIFTLQGYNGVSLND